MSIPGTVKSLQTQQLIHDGQLCDLIMSSLTSTRRSSLLKVETIHRPGGKRSKVHPYHTHQSRDTAVVLWQNKLSH